MKQLFLSSEFSVSGDKLRKVVNLDEFNSVAYIGNAADLDEDKGWTESNKKKFNHLGFDLIEVDLREFEGKDIQDELEKYDALYFEGGNTFYLLNLCNKVGLTDKIHELTEDKLFIGTSAGSIITGPNIESTKYIDEPEAVPELQDFTAFNMVNFVIVPHIGNKDFFQNNEEEYVELFRNLKNSLYPHVAIRDEQAVWVEDDKIKIL